MHWYCKALVDEAVMDLDSMVIRPESWESLAGGGMGGWGIGRKEEGGRRKRSG